jgi:hypothetical protein
MNLSRLHFKARLWHWMSVFFVLILLTSVNELGSAQGSVGVTPTIDVLVLYTPQVAPRLGSNPRISIQKTIDLQNRIFVNSGVNAKVRLCDVGIISNFDESQLRQRLPTEIMEKI